MTKKQYVAKKADQKAIEILWSLYMEVELDAGHLIFNAQLYLKDRKRYAELKASVENQKLRLAVKYFLPEHRYEGFTGSYRGLGNRDSAGMENLLSSQQAA